jgi:hypothetical protein
MTMTDTPTLPALIEAYLADLDRALAGADPRERAETLAAVRDHATEALSLRDGESDNAAIMRVLAELGPVDAIAAAATPVSSGLSTLLASRTSDPSKEDGPLLGVSILSLIVPFLGVATLIWSSMRLWSRTGNRGRQIAALIVSIVTVIAHLVVAVGLTVWSVDTDSVQQAPVSVSIPAETP